MTVKLHIRLSNGVKFSTDFEGTTVLQCKEWLHSEHSCPVPSLQRLVFKGRILDDADVLEDSGVVSGSTLFLVTVKNKPATESKAAPSPAVASTEFPAAPTTTPASASPPLPASPPNNDMFQQYMQMQNQQQPASQNPMDQAQQALNNPMFQSLLNSNPEFLTNMLQRQMESNPALRQLMESNPMVREVLQDPSSLRQMLQAAANPDLRMQQQRQHDLALSQIENMPGGFNALRNLYESVQGPLEESMMDSQGDGTTNDNTTTSSGAEGASGRAMPNPWGAPANNQSAPAPAGQGGSTANPFGMNPEMLQSMLSGGGGAMNNDMLQNMMQGGAAGGGGQQREAALQMLEQNPQLQQMMQQTISQNPGLIRNLIAQSNPMAAAMVQNMDDRQLQQMMSMAMNPAALRSAMQMEQQMGAMGMNPSNMFGGSNPWASNNAGAAANQGGLDFSSLLQPRAPQATQPSNPRERYSRQLQQMASMGFDDEPRVLDALSRAHGNLNRAVDLLLTTTSADDAPSSEENNNQQERQEEPQPPPAAPKNAEDKKKD